jgi:hypothetical protein
MEESMEITSFSLVADGLTKRLKHSCRYSGNNFENIVFKRRKPVWYVGKLRDKILEKSFPSYLNIKNVLNKLIRKKKKEVRQGKVKKMTRITDEETTEKL